MKLHLIWNSNIHDYVRNSMNKWDKRTQLWCMWALMRMLTSINSDWNWKNAEMNAKQEALAVGYANDQTCALQIEMLEVANQNQTMKHTMAMNVRRLETELDAADMKRDEDHEGVP